MKRMVFGKATGVTGPGNKAVLPPPKAPPKTSPVPPAATPGGGKITVRTPDQKTVHSKR